MVCLLAISMSNWSYKADSCDAFSMIQDSKFLWFYTWIEITIRFEKSISQIFEGKKKKKKIERILCESLFKWDQLLVCTSGYIHWT